MFETICALSTPPMISALAVIRVSGQDAFIIVSKIFSKSLLKVDNRTIFVGKIINKEEIVDEVVLLAYVSPKSFTGENMVEIICHGSPLICNQIIGLLINNGARMATNGEFSSRAFLNNKIDLIQAEAINDVIHATTKEAKYISMLALDGEVSSLITPLKTQIADLLSLIEVNIDYPEYEDIEQANKTKVIQTCKEVIALLNTQVRNAREGKLIKEGINVAIIGKPNVGKSSLLNAFLGENKAIVTSQAGTTRDIVEGEINLNGLRIRLLDTAGIRKTNDKIESIGVKKAKATLKKADLVILVLDGTKPKEPEDDYLLDLTKKMRRIIVLNKSDRKRVLRGDYINISALKSNIKPLEDEIFSIFNVSQESFQRPSLNNARQIGLLVRAEKALKQCVKDASKNLTVDLIAVSLREAYDAILEILGEENSRDFEKEIFSRFCVGK